MQAEVLRKLNSAGRLTDHDGGFNVEVSIGLDGARCTKGLRRKTISPASSDGAFFLWRNQPVQWDWLIGISVFQADDAGSIPAARLAEFGSQQAGRHH